MRIEYLCDYLGFAETIARWTYDEFVKGIRDDFTYEMVLHKLKTCYKSEFPVRLVAVDGNRCIGNVFIVQNDLKSRDYTPWLASLYVDAEFRNRKVGETLIESVKNIVKGLGYQEVYLRTEHASGYYRKLGWQFVESCDDNFNLKPDVFKFAL